MKKRLLVVLSIIPLLFLSSCQPQDINYNNFEHVNNETFFNKITRNYAVYIYSDYCSHCVELKEYVANYISSAFNSEIPLYLYNVLENENKFLSYESLPNLTTKENMERCFELSKNATKIDELYLYGTPTIYVLNFNDIQNVSYLSNEYIGTENIKSFLTKSSVKLPIFISLSVVAAVFLTGVAVFTIYKKKRGLK